MKALWGGVCLIFTCRQLEGALGCISVLTEVARASGLGFSGGSWACWKLTGHCTEAFKWSHVIRVLNPP